MGFLRSHRQPPGRPVRQGPLLSGTGPMVPAHPFTRSKRDRTAGDDRTRDRVLLAARITYDRAPKRPGGGPWRVPVDQTLRCRECGVDFIWTEGEQQFFSSKGLTNPPSRCPSCRAARKAAGMGGGGYGGGGGGGGRSGGPRQMFEVTCAGCGGIARVPFQPRGDKPVYCSEC